MATLSSPAAQFFSPDVNRRPTSKLQALRSQATPNPESQHNPPSSSSFSTNGDSKKATALTIRTQRSQGTIFKLEKLKDEESKERKEETNRKIASRKAISVILRREATKALIEKKKGNNSKKLLPRTVLEALYERITALRWESALKVRYSF